MEVNGDDDDRKFLTTKSWSLCVWSLQGIRAYRLPVSCARVASLPPRFTEGSLQSAISSPFINAPLKAKSNWIRTVISLEQ